MSKKALWGSFQTDHQVFSVKLGEFSSFPYTQDQEGLPFCPCDETYLSDSKKKLVLFGLLVNFRTITKGSWGKSLLSFLGLALQDCSHTFLRYTKLLLNTHWPSKSIQKKKKKVLALWGILFVYGLASDTSSSYSHNLIAMAFQIMWGLWGEKDWSWESGGLLFLVITSLWRVVSSWGALLKRDMEEQWA